MQKIKKKKEQTKEYYEINKEKINEKRREAYKLKKEINKL